MDTSQADLFRALPLLGASHAHLVLGVVLALLAFLVWRAWPGMPVHHQLDYRARLIGYPRYTDYLASGHWQRIKAATYRRYRGRCNVCGASKRHICHHRTYARIGREIASDTVLLCSKCHTAVHVLARSGVPLIRADLVYRSRRKNR